VNKGSPHVWKKLAWVKVSHHGGGIKELVKVQVRVSGFRFD
jgi:hypothetical protein